MQVAKHASIGQISTGYVVVIGPHLFLKGVGKVKRLVVRAPARAVRADDSGVDFGQRKISVEPPQAAQRQLLFVVHAARKKTASTVTFAVI